MNKSGESNRKDDVIVLRTTMAPTIGRVIWVFSDLWIGESVGLITDTQSTPTGWAVDVVVFPNRSNGTGATMLFLGSLPISDPLDEHNRCTLDDNMRGWCEWMPYQKGQAQKAEALEKRLLDQDGKNDKQGRTKYVSVAKELYEAYRAYTGGKSLATGKAIPEWADLPDVIQAAWEAAAYKAHFLLASDRII